MIIFTLFLIFLKIGAFTFGGGYAMIPFIESEVVSPGYISGKELVDFLAISESTPGPFAVNISTFIGATKGGLLGALASTLGVILPSFIIILIVAKFFEKFKTNKIVNGAMNGLRPAVVGLIASAVITVGKTVFIPQGNIANITTIYSLICSAVVFIIMLILSLRKVHPILIIILSAALGIAAGFIGKMF